MKEDLFKMTIYSVVIIMLFALFLLELIAQGSRAKKRLFIIASGIVFFIMSFRGKDVGGDMIEYVHFWQGIDDMYGTWKSPNIVLVLEPGLSWLCYFLHLFNDGDAWFFVFATSIIIICPFFYLIWRDSNNKVMSILLFFIMWGLLDISFTGLRQVIGVSFCILAYIVWTSTFKRKWFRNILIVFLIAFALTFHTTTIFAIILCLCMLFVKKMHKRTLLFSLVLSLIIGIVFAKIVPYLFDRIASISTSFELLFRYDHYFEEEGLTEGRIGITQILTTLLIMIVVSLAKEDCHNVFYVNCLVLGNCLLNIFVPFPNAGRFLYPVLIMGLVSSPSLLNVKRYTGYKIILFLFTAILAIHQIKVWEDSYNDKNSSAYIYNQMFPYNFIWE